MKKQVLTILLAALAVWSAAAQESFQAGPFLQMQGGAAYDRGEGSLLQSLSPAAQVALGYRFTPVLGARFAVSGYQAKNFAEVGGTPYHFHFVQPSLDLQAFFFMFDPLLRKRAAPHIASTSSSLPWISRWTWPPSSGDGGPTGA